MQTHSSSQLAFLEHKHGTGAVLGAVNMNQNMSTYHFCAEHLVQEIIHSQLTKTNSYKCSNKIGRCLLWELHMRTSYGGGSKGKDQEKQEF